jgi:hypothetical protein
MTRRKKQLQKMNIIKAKTGGGEELEEQPYSSVQYKDTSGEGKV